MALVYKLMAMEEEPATNGFHRRHTEGSEGCKFDTLEVLSSGQDSTGQRCVESSGPKSSGHVSVVGRSVQSRA